MSGTKNPPSIEQEFTEQSIEETLVDESFTDSETPISELINDKPKKLRSHEQSLYKDGDERPYGADQSYTGDDEGRYKSDNRAFNRDDDALTPDPANYTIEDAEREAAKKP